MPLIWRTADTLPSRASAPQGLPYATERQIEVSQPGRDVAPRLLAVGRHQIERRPNLLSWAGDDADPGRADVCLVELHLQSQPLQHGLLGHVLAVVGGIGGTQSGDRAAGVRDLLVQPVRRVITPFMIMAFDAEIGGNLGISRHAFVNVAIGDRIDSTSRSLLRPGQRRTPPSMSWTEPPTTMSSRLSM